MTTETKLFNLVKKDKEELDNVYYGNKTLMSNYHIFNQNLHKEETRAFNRCLNHQLILDFIDT